MSGQIHPKRLSIGVDFDGVIVDTTALKQEQALRLYGVSLKSHECKEGAVISKGLMTHAQYRELMARVCGDMGVGLQMESLEGSIEFLQKLLRQGHSIKIITARADADLEVAKQWCAEKNLVIDFVSVGYGGSKLEAAEGLDIYIDDDLQKLLPLQGKVQNLFLFHWSYNADDLEPAEIKRVSSWQKIEDTIKPMLQPYA
ncbi:hypothetical protein COX00_00815 [Candidatus Uhrbacteria bacterium CG22_combo_CG10-13_8_21_14_all_47_17]|uniref:Phosphatase n=1 Tax=Candidatus Uhrbacteria bacterium CG22_combo_CG10-13_8_21_14_all_47_17 TaxID=1975041 RepID=A0A2H0BTA9_9BACT|nr:MAG: hypothetical protein COX00_00815 [Candidatus Uhrbacteria bacterium CG22_combo_CG10-13_8_21_14_all_47_17]